MGDQFNMDKAIQGLLLIAKSLGKVDRHKAFKIMYFADQKHLTRYGRFVFGDKYYALPDGPVPTQIYDYIKYSNSDLIVNEGMFIKPIGSLDLDEFSATDLECLKESIEENKDLNFSQLKNKSHKTAYNSTIRNGRISDRDIAREANASDEMLQYIAITDENIKHLWT